MGNLFTFILIIHKSLLKLFICLILFFIILGYPIFSTAIDDHSLQFKEDILALSSIGDRSMGTKGNEKAALYIKEAFRRTGFDQIGSHFYPVPVRRHGGSRLLLMDKEISLPILPMKSNIISPGATPKEGLEGPLIYVGRGNLTDFNGEVIAGSIILMDIDSGKNWLHAANLGAKALIYIDQDDTSKTVFKEKTELTPILFPCFWISMSELRESMSLRKKLSMGLVSSKVRLHSDITWEETMGENIYCFIPGTDPMLSKEVVLVEGFYDSTAMVFERSPGSDEAMSVATLLDLARALKRSPPKRSVLLVATSGHSQTLAGMRELFWSISARSKDQKRLQARFKGVRKKTRDTVKILKKVSFVKPMDEYSERLFREAVGERIKIEVDGISRRLMRLRLEGKNRVDQEMIKELAEKRLLLRRLGWRSDLKDLSPAEMTLLQSLIPMSMEDQKALLTDAKRQIKMLKSSRRFRSLIKSKDLVAALSLHLSSHGDGFGAFNEGWLYPLKPTINRVAAYGTLERLLRDAASSVEEFLGITSLFKDTLRPRRIRTWRSYFLDQPPLGGEVSALAGYLGVSLVTVNDSRSAWGTPYDVPDRLDMDYALQQNDYVKGIIRYLMDVPVIKDRKLPRKGFSAIAGRANFIRHGELFPDQPAPGSVILAYQGSGIYHAIVDHMGMFQLRGVADRKNVAHKVIIEGYRFDPEDGSVVWAIDKKQTGKKAYRVKMQRRYMETDLVMFACKETTFFNLLEPRNFHYMTKIKLIDGRREAPPMRYWWSRIDTRSSVIASVYLEPGTPLKMTLSDSMIQKKLILTNANSRNSLGRGYRVDDWPFLHQTEYKIAKDMWMLLGPRIANLETHGIYNERIRKLHDEGVSAIGEADSAYKEKKYNRFMEAATRSWALATRVYDHVEKTQRDVLLGVLFYIALFVPFAFCLERLLFCYSSIHKRIIAFLVILTLLIAVIYKVHPAFQLAYSPMVVILAFFIIGLSVMVALIIFFRFEEEINRLQSRATQLEDSGIGRWKAFTAAFLLGVSNLRRRRIRTGLTCVTLIILTFTIMSFTSVKTMRHHARVQFNDSRAYQGFLLKHLNWGNLPSESLEIISNSFEKEALLAPRVWFEQADKTRPTLIPVRNKNGIYEAKGLIGLSSVEGQVTGLSGILVGGRWLRDDDHRSVLLSERMARHLGISPNQPNEAVVQLWGVPYKVVGVFSGKSLQERSDLDGEPLTPVIFPSEASMEMTEIEIEAQESGEDIKTFQSRYQHIPGELTLIVPYRTLLSLGGNLKSVAVRPGSADDTRDRARFLSDRFGLTLFSGESEGTFLYHASDTLSYSGVPNIIIPLIISVFIVLNTMIGSVYERKREIAVYTSVGLAPSHVSFLFIAESMAFAVISVVLGYLFAQITSFLLSGTPLWAGITVNYSSLSGVGAMLLVILVVLVSVIYPSKVAGEIAIPDVNRAWKLPDSDGHVLDLKLPFLMKHGEQRSIGGYIFEYFKGHQDVSHGLFSTGNLQVSFACPRLSCGEDGHSECNGSNCFNSECLMLHSKVWLAPFDLGITQGVDIQFCPSADEKDFLEIRICLEREAGEANTWKKINKGFLNQLRKQLLMWRSFDTKTQTYYRSVITTALSGYQN